MNIGETKEGLVHVVRRRGNSVLIRPLAKIKGRWVRRRDVRLVENVERGIKLRMAKDVGFDQVCGCTAVAEFRSGVVETFNVYGDLRSYIRSKIRKGQELSDWKRRMFLKSEGFVRGRGIRTDVKDVGRKVRQFERKGYEVV